MEAQSKLRTDSVAFKPTEEELKRFWSLVNKDGPLPDQSIPDYAGLDQCWVWTGPLSYDGYAPVYMNGKSYRVHRISFLLHHGYFPINGNACHKCDLRHCLNPLHLFDGTTKDNCQDKVRKGRSVKGEKNGRCRVSEDDVAEIKRLRGEGWILRRLGEKFGIHLSVVCKIVRGDLWKHTLNESDLTRKSLEGLFKGVRTQPLTPDSSPA